MVVSSGAGAKAYVLSNYQNLSFCSSQQLLAFDPLTPPTAPIWAKMTLVSGTSNFCGHLGLTFGREESFLYAFSWYNN